MTRALFGSLFACGLVMAQVYTRGPGQYPGAPAEFKGPVVKADTSGVERNLALRRPAYHSSAYDYYLTAQLATDSIRDTRPPRYLAVSTSDRGVLPRHERELMFDDNWVTAVEVKGKSAWIQIQMAGGDAAPLVDRVELDGSLRAAAPDWENWTVVVKGSDNGSTWSELGRLDNMSPPPAGVLKPTVSFAKPARSRFLRIEMITGRSVTWHIGEIRLSSAGKVVKVAGPHQFSSAWMSATGGEQWIYVDLGAVSSLTRAVFAWIQKPPTGAIEVSDDAQSWRRVADLGGDRVDLPLGTSGRYVRASLSGGSQPYVLSEFEVWGKGGMTVEPTEWRVQRDSQVTAAPRALSTAGFNDRDWLPATVPGTVLVSYLNAGAIPDPNYGTNQFQISDSYFHSDFWYRHEFEAPPPAGKRMWLNFAGINWKADIYLNGEKLGRIEGAFQRARFDVTAKLHAGKNALAVRIEKNATPGVMKEKTFDSPGTNGGALGADNPTFHASIGWDWIPTIHGRDTGIWNDVFLSTSGAVTIDNPFASPKLSDGNTRADVALEATLHNHSGAPVSGTLRGTFGDIPFEQSVTLPPSSERVAKVALQIQNPRLWWPNGYGAQDRYPVSMRFEAAGGGVSDEKKFETGIRQFTYSEEGGALKMWINGRRFVPRGGNWGFGESMLRYRAREYDIAVNYHRDSNFTMIRNWVGMIGEDAFYEACDRHGIVIWQDFWLANPWDGPNPDDNGMFMRNVRDTIQRIRNHPSVGLYCGRNEGYPTLTLDTAIRASLDALHPNMHYIPSSADDAVSGHGPYQAMPVKFYFNQRATPKMHSELGMPNIMNMDSMRLTMPEAEMWPQAQQWGVHDFSLHGAQGGESFRKMIDSNYGGAKNAHEWVSLAQFVNYEGHRAMFEAQSKHRMGLLIWMSHPAWPSLVWQTYDYFFDTTAGYYGAKKASEPLHIQWNPVSSQVEVVNYNAGNRKGLVATAEVRNLDGSVVFQKSSPVLDSTEDSVRMPFDLELKAPGLSPVHFIRLTLAEDGKEVSQNTYWHATDEGNYQPIRTLPAVKVVVGTLIQPAGGKWKLTTTLQNSGNAPALMVRVKAVRSKTRDYIVPAVSSDNYLILMPGEKRVITTEIADADTRGEAPEVVVEGFNVTP